MMMDSGFGFSSFDSFDSIMFTIVPVVVVIGFIVVIGSFIVMAVRGTAQWNRNNQSPRLTVDAELVSRRTEVSTFHHGGHNGTDMCRTSSSTTYYVTFQVDSGDRMEFSVSGQEYGLLAEGDRGKLTFQGTRYLGFEREKAERT